MRIALVEDDSAQAQQLTLWLEKAGHSVLLYTHGAALTQALRRESFDLFIFDWGLPDTTGLELLKQMKMGGDLQAPVIFVTSRSLEKDIVLALREGADDYLVKPVREFETLARIDAVTRRNQRDVAVLSYPPFVLNSENCVVTCAQEQIQLTHKEFELARFMFESSGRVRSRSHLLEAVWGIKSELNTRTVDTHISLIRRKLGLRPERGWRLVSVYQYGYRLEPVPGRLVGEK